MANRDPKYRWFRTYADIVDNARIRLLAFEDRWHFVALCALKCNGMLEDGNDPLLERKIALKLGVQLRELDEIKRRLMEVGLIDEGFAPIKWEMRQHRKADLPEGEDLGAYRGYVYFISDDNRKTVKIGYSKNPWARVKDLQTGRTAKLSVVATLRTTEVSENDIHSIFDDERQSGEWFVFSPRIEALIQAIKGKKVRDAGCVADYVSGYVATTKDTDTDTDTDTEVLEPKGSCASDDALKPEHICEKWNEVAPTIGKPSIRKLTPERRQLLKARIAQNDLDDFVAVFAAIKASPFLRGDTGWRGCNFDWVFKKANFQKILEGNYNG
tara:strand:+ start:29 stop:1009 length:981 start_codon:yes stop_codon:yes gene_type:complete